MPGMPELDVELDGGGVTVGQVGVTVLAPDAGGLCRVFGTSTPELAATWSVPSSFPVNDDAVAVFTMAVSHAAAAGTEATMWVVPMVGLGSSGIGRAVSVSVFWPGTTPSPVRNHRRCFGSSLLGAGDADTRVRDVGKRSSWIETNLPTQPVAVMVMVKVTSPPGAGVGLSTDLVRVSLHSVVGGVLVAVAGSAAATVSAIAVTKPTGTILRINKALLSPGALILEPAIQMAGGTVLRA